MACSPHDDAGREYLMELLLPISVGPNAADKMPNAIEVWAPWMQQKEAGALIDQINLMPIYQRKPTAQVLGERLRVTNGERERLRLWTIAPCDMGQRGMAWWRRLKDSERKHRLRQLRGRKSRAQYESGSINRTKPWLALQMSRATWYRQRETSPSEVRFNNAVDTPVSLRKR